MVLGLFPITNAHQNEHQRPSDEKNTCLPSRKPARMKIGNPVRYGATACPIISSGCREMAMQLKWNSFLVYHEKIKHSCYKPWDVNKTIHCPSFRETPLLKIQYHGFIVEQNGRPVFNAKKMTWWNHCGKIVCPSDLAWGEKMFISHATHSHEHGWTYL